MYIQRAPIFYSAFLLKSEILEKAIQIENKKRR